MITIDAARALYTGDDSAHDFAHVLRVWQLAERIGDAEGADLRILRTARLLHDIGRVEEARMGRCHAQVGAEMARRVLASCQPSTVDAVASAIAEHRFRGDRTPSTIESRVLFDADKLDAIGAIGVARAYAVAGLYGQALWSPVDPGFLERPARQAQQDLQAREHTPVHEYLYKLRRLPERMTTPTGRALAEGRAAFMRAFFERLQGEVEGRF